MATVTGYTAARMAAIENASVIDGDVVGDNLILTRYDTTTINAGSVRGPVGPQGPADTNSVKKVGGDTITASAVGVKPLVVKAFSAGQTANLLEGQDSSGVVVSGMTAAGKLFGGTIRIPHTWHVPNEVKVAVGDTDFIMPFFIPEPAGQTAKLVAVRYKINAGTSATFKLTVDAVDALGFTALAATTTTATTDPADVDVTNGQAIFLVISSVSGVPTNLAVTVWVDYSF